jgi:hypothetical protein
VKAAHFCQASGRNVSPEAFAESAANQLTKTVEGFGGALAATLSANKGAHQHVHFRSELSQFMVNDRIGVRRRPESVGEGFVVTELPARISANINTFTGRTLLLPKILDWWQRQTDERFLLLTWGPGAGKSMVLAGANRWERTRATAEKKRRKDAGVLSQDRDEKIAVRRGAFREARGF